MKFTAKQLRILGVVALVAGGAINLVSSLISNERASIETKEAAAKAVEERILEIKGA